jgi:hypothetical protein
MQPQESNKPLMFSVIKNPGAGVEWRVNAPVAGNRGAPNQPGCTLPMAERPETDRIGMQTRFYLNHTDWIHAGRSRRTAVTTA